jgi:hypothetical protein
MKIKSLKTLLDRTNDHIILTFLNLNGKEKDRTRPREFGQIDDL